MCKSHYRAIGRELRRWMEDGPLTSCWWRLELLLYLFLISISVASTSPGELHAADSSYVTPLASSHPSNYKTFLFVEKL